MNNQTSSNNRSFLQRPGAVLYDDPDEALEQITGGTVTSSTTTSAVVGTPEDLVAAIRQVAEVTGGSSASLTTGPIVKTRCGPGTWLPAT